MKLSKLNPYYDNSKPIASKRNFLTLVGQLFFQKYQEC